MLQSRMNSVHVGGLPLDVLDVPCVQRFSHPLTTRIHSREAVLLFEMLGREGYVKFETAKVESLASNVDIYLKAYLDGILMARHVTRLGFSHLGTKDEKICFDAKFSSVKNMIKNHFSEALETVVHTESEIEFNFSLGMLELYCAFLRQFDPDFDPFPEF